MYEQALNDVVRVLPEPTLLVSTRGVVYRANGALLRLLKAHGSSVQGQSLADLVADPPDRVNELLRLCSGSGDMLHGALTFRLNSGEELSCRARGALVCPRIDPLEQQSIGMILLRIEPKQSPANRFLVLNQKIRQLASEVHRRRTAEGELRRFNQELEQRVAQRTAELSRANEALTERNRELQDFAYVASHDLQEPLRKIRTFLGLIQEEMTPQSDHVREYFLRVERSAARMSELITDLLALSRVGTRGRPFQPVALNRVVDELLPDLEVQIRDAEARIEVGDLPTIEADPIQMRQLFQNLISNALKFRRPDVQPHVIIQAHHENGTSDAAVHNPALCRIVVTDNGIGFDPLQADRIFMPFRQLHGRDAYGGSGIGLTICRRVVQRHGGAIRASGRPGEGSQFIVELPERQSVDDG